ncbi:MAG: HNH endonuclease [Myxococcaceae bacterium]|nr:HNH endonuclease [Myxococcaceae bacterium]
MRRSTRGAPPAEFPQPATAWTDQWLRRCGEAAGAGARAPKFSWPEVRGVGLNHRLLPALREMTQGHCAYCDTLIDLGLAESIDHFRPKACGRFPQGAFDWANLFLACATCQRQKGDQDEPALLKPDEAGYSFEAWFTVRAKDGALEPRADLSGADRKRAEATIRVLG